MPITHAQTSVDTIGLHSTRCHPRTTLEAFPDDRAEYACALEGPRPSRRGWWSVETAIALACAASAAVLTFFGG